MFWKTRWENSIDGSSTSHRTLVGYKESLTGTEIDGLPSMWTGTWRDTRFSPPADGGDPENALTGTLWTVNSGTAAITVPEAMGKLRLWRGITGVADLAPGASATLGVDTLGYEWDEDVNNGCPARPGLMRLSSTTVGGVERVLDDNGVVVGIGTATHNLTHVPPPRAARSSSAPAPCSGRGASTAITIAATRRRIRRTCGWSRPPSTCLRTWATSSPISRLAVR